MPTIHHTAIVDRNADLAYDVQVGPFSIIGPQVKIGRGTVVGSHCVLEGKTSIGEFNKVHHHVMLGQIPQDLKFRGENSALEVGDHNEFREFTTVHIGTDNGGGITRIGSHNLIMVNAHIAHDCHVADHCVLSNNVMLAGHVLVEDHAVLAGGLGVQHFATIGRNAFVAGLSGVVHDVPPFMMAKGDPARPRAINAIGLSRHQFEPETVAALKKACTLLFGGKSPSQAAALEQVEAEFGEDRCIQELIDFVRRSSNAPNGRHLEALRADNKREAQPR